MSTLHYCDTDDCQNSDHSYDKGIYPLVSREVGEALVKKRWIFHTFDIHICKDCIDNYYNEEDEQLKVVNGYIELGKYFKGTE